jgi:septal ring factor EnvC (AmiA/AmiB activator)
VQRSLEPGFICRWFYNLQERQLHRVDDVLDGAVEVEEGSLQKLRALHQRTEQLLGRLEQHNRAVRAEAAREAAAAADEGGEAAAAAGADAADVEQEEETGASPGGGRRKRVFVASDEGSSGDE